jgi:hypothetical protein
MVVPGLVIEVDRKLIAGCGQSDKKGPLQERTQKSESVNPIAGGRSVSHAGGQNDPAKLRRERLSLRGKLGRPSSLYRRQGVLSRC